MCPLPELGFLYFLLCVGTSQLFTFKELPRGTLRNCSFHRRLTSRQHSLILSYAEDETDVEGTVNGVTNTSTGRVARWHVGIFSVPRRMNSLEACRGYLLSIFVEPPESTVERGELRAWNSCIQLCSRVQLLLPSVLVPDHFLPDSSPVSQRAALLTVILGSATCPMTLGTSPHESSCNSLGEYGLEGFMHS